MTRISEESANSRALTTLTELARDGVGQPTHAELDQGLNALYTRIAAGRVRRRERVRWTLAAALVVASALVLVQVASIFRGYRSASEVPALAYEIEGGSVLEGGYLRESGHEGVQLRFNEGSRVVLQPGTRGRLRAVDAAGARVAIENGMASFQVTQGSDRHWVVEVGPFLVTVKGTVFTVAWDPEHERFELRLRRGRVEVSGPVSGGSLSLQAGQRLVVDLAKAETVITEERPEVASGEDSAALPVPSAGPDASGASSGGDGPRGSASSAPAGSTAARAAGEHRWSDELAQGHWDRILEEVDRQGVEATLRGASSEELSALADAARYRRRTDLARAALMAQRRRFPSSPRALDAIFLLGRVEEGQSKAKALASYDEYLARAPSGPYAAEALGRKMTLTDGLSGQESARPIAEEYLRRFPKGSYAGSARALLRAP